MTWNRWYAFRSYLRASLWIVLFVVLLLEQATFRLGSIDISDHTRFEIIDRRGDLQLPGPGETG